MKTAILCAMVIVALSSLPVISRQNDADAEESATVRVSTQSDSPAAMQPVKVELVGGSDASTAMVGDTMVVETKENVRTAEDEVIPTGSRLVGRVTESAHADSGIRIVFDRAELKGGGKLPIWLVMTLPALQR